MGDFTYRRSDASDYDAVRNCLLSSFPVWDMGDKLDGIALGRYLVCEYKGRIVGISGMRRHEVFPSAYSVDWTCTLPEYRRMGAASGAIQRIIYEARHRNVKRLYWYAWHVEAKENVSIISVLNKFGFKEGIHSVYRKSTEFNCLGEKISCPGRLNGNCWCSIDLYYLDL